ncbi:hypothetical protein ESCO_001004 [Escovopsis weberi]|uniref:Uncharacterized protein n=1 Tax=Escovopsis weberi TaxID=150374 RepID=A0A0M8N3F6_ESCWE|nr:hypothetical protein ESCO_001004 [Escovopsis weberi]
MNPAPAALSTVRGFRMSSTSSTDEDSDGGGINETARLSACRGRPRIDDVVSENCSPVLRAHASPSISGISLLRLQMDPLSLDGNTRTNSMTCSGGRLTAGSAFASLEAHGADTKNSRGISY